MPSEPTGETTTTVAEASPATTEGIPDEDEGADRELEVKREDAEGEDDARDAEREDDARDDSDDEDDLADPQADESGETDEEGSGIPETTKEDDTADQQAPGDAEFELDPNLLIGSLENGLTYYIRHNDSPGGRAELRLVVKVGTLQENDEESGYAHFLEHMMFNGTEKYPRNELVAALEKLGTEFGPDLNAFTTYTFTNYHLSLADNEVDSIDNGLDILYEWAVNATLAEEEVISERGVVDGEYRDGRQGLSGRFRIVSDELFKRGSNLYGRDVLGAPESIMSVDSESLREFYEEWYRPELMAVVAVGEFATNAIKQLIIDRFSSLPKAGPDAPAPAAATMTSSGEPQTTFQFDPEYPAAAVIAQVLSPQTELHTRDGRRTAIARDIAFDILTERLNNDSLRGNAAFNELRPFSRDYAASVRYKGAVAYTESDNVLGTVEDILREFERVRQHGFGGGEFTRATDAMRREIEQEYASRSTKQDSAYASEYVSHFALGHLPMSVTDSTRLAEEILNELTSIDAAEAIVDLLAVEPPRLWIVVNESAATLPDEADIAEIRKRVQEEEIPAREDWSVTAQALMERPDPVEATSREELALGITQIEFPNGARVLLKPTEISAKEVQVWAASAGGTSLLPDEIVKHLDITNAIARRSGVGPYDRVTLNQMLADDVLSIRTYLDHNSEYVIARAALEDLETLFQLIHLTMTAPMAEEAIVESELSQWRQAIENKDVLASNALESAVREERYGDDPRFTYLPTLEEIETFDIGRSMDEFRKRFADAGDFLYIVVGDFEVSEVESLAASYIGTLPDGGVREAPIDPHPPPPPGIIRRTVMAGEDQQGELVLLLSGEVETDLRVRLAAQVLKEILSTRLHVELRENLTASYNPEVSVSYQDPDDLIETRISMIIDPDRLDELSDALLAELADLATNGPAEEEFATAQSLLITEFGWTTNEDWINALSFLRFHPEESLELVADRGAKAAITESLTIEEIADLARIAFPSDRYIEVRLLPLE